MGKKGRKAQYTKEQRVLLARIEKDVAAQLDSKPRRLAHSRSVAKCAERLAQIYGVDPFLARASGLLHDWEKANGTGEQMRHAAELGLDFGVDLQLVKPLLHGAIAAHVLPERYPELPEEVWHAIRVHTTASAEMGPLDMVLFVADGIEKLRPPTPGIEATRALVGTASLEDLFWESFVGGILYVLETERYLYPGTIDTYNALLAKRTG